MKGVVCDLCQRELEPAETVFREIEGWEKIRDQGGANQIALRKETGRVACFPCIDRLAKGLAGQMDLTELLA